MTDDLKVMLGQLDGKMDMVLKSLDEGKVVMVTLEARTAKLERWQSRLMGGAAVAGFVAGIVARLVTS